jgi:renierapurpurin 18,18'-hydroxylase
MAVEAEQHAWDEQGEDWNQEVFPLILDVRGVLRANGIPIRPGPVRCGAAAFAATPLCSAGHDIPVPTSPQGQ